MDLKQHVDVGRELDPLAVGQTQHLVVVQDCVHVLYPQCIHGAVTDDPLVILGCVLGGQEVDNVKIALGNSRYIVNTCFRRIKKRVEKSLT